MLGDEIDTTTPPAPDALDPAALKNAHGRTGRMLQNAGLPFEDEEFEEAPSVEAPDDAGGSAGE